MQGFVRKSSMLIAKMFLRCATQIEQLAFARKLAHCADSSAFAYTKAVPANLRCASALT